MTSDYPDALNVLKTKVWKTKGARFNAYRRLQSRKTWGSYLVSAYSSYILIVAIYSLTQSAPDSFLNMLSIIGSLLILVFSLHEGSQNAEQKAERHHNCAKQLSALYDKIIIELDSPSTTKAEKLANKYAAIIANSPENHETIDYEFFLTEDDTLQTPKPRKQIIKLKYSAFKTACILFIAIPPAFLFIAHYVHPLISYLLCRP